MQIEICTSSVEGACIAQAAGACRIELCCGLCQGGLTPSAALISSAVQNVAIKVYVLIRPRGGDFLYSDAEFEIMKSDIHYCGQNGCGGVVIGMLRPNGTVDMERCQALVHIAHRYGMGVTFHRAFDRSCNLFTAAQDIIALGCERILTSGGYNTALEGAEVIRELMQQVRNKIIIMPGSGITAQNAGTLIKMTGLKELHGTFRTLCDSKMQYKNTKLNYQEAEYTTDLPDAEQIKHILSIV